MANERLRPFRDYDEHDVLNLFAFGDSAVALGTTDVVYAGSVVKIKTICPPREGSYIFCQNSA